MVTSVNKPERLFVPLMKVPFPALIKGLCMCRHVQSSYGRFWAPTPLPRTPTDTQFRPRLRTTLLFSELSLSFDTWASACSRSWMKNQPGTHLLHLLSCLLPYFLPLRRKTISASPGIFFFTVQAVIFHVTLLLLVLVFSAGTWNIFSVMFHGPCCMRLRPGYIWKSCFSLIFSHPPTTFIIFIPFFMLKSTSALDEFIWFGFCWHKWD